MTGQTQQERQKIRAQMRDMRDKISANSAAIGDVNAHVFHELRDANNKLGLKAKHMRESVLDVANVYSLTHAATKQAAALAVVNQAVSCDRLLKELRKRGVKDDDGEDGEAGSGRFDWKSLGRAVAPFFATPPTVEFLCGPISKPVVARQERGKRKADAVDDEEEGEAKNERPEDVTSKDDELVESTQARLKVMTDRLPPDSSPMGFFNFLVNPESFTQTVENIFDFSFLIKQGTGCLTVKDGLPYVNKSYKHGDAKDIQELPSSQLVMALCPADFRRAKELFNCRGEGIPHRDDPSYEPNYLGHMVGKNGRSSSSSSSSSSPSSSLPASAAASSSSSSSKPKGKGKARA